MFWRRKTGRSDIVAKNGMVAASQPLATQAGIEILKKGGNAIDAAIATAATLDVVEPFSTGCGGDAFALIHKPGMKKPLSYNGSGRSGSLANLESLREKGWFEMPFRGGPTVSVPGAMHLWGTLLKEHGNLEMKDVLAPAIGYAQDGFPVSPILAQHWHYIPNVLRNDDARRIFHPNGMVPGIGAIVKNPELAEVFTEVSNNGIEHFYTGRIAESIVSTVQDDEGFLTLEDLEKHQTEKTKPISTDYRGVEVFEHPPNGQGFAALIMLNIMEEFALSELHPLAAERYHLMIEAKKLAYDDLHRHNADPAFYDVPIDELLSKEYAMSRSTLIDPNTSLDTHSLEMKQGPDTVYLCTADGEGNAVSFINSLYMGIGSGLVAKGTGIKLQNRASHFSLDPNHPNKYEPGKRPYHTIIPGALYRDGDLYGVFGIMGGAHQAQAHAQFVSNIVDCNMSPQEAMDHPRFNHDQVPNTVGLENAVPADVQGQLRMRGHKLVHETMSGFGGGQVILRLDDVWIAGSDYRKDGQAAGF
ncbi:MAG: gamma-glutamyltransferase [Candidatus Thorarchaeota archaeon]|nr:gamma-glutamyltransferase [Candidatus Thorarchaeota archaeon]